MKELVGGFGCGRTDCEDLAASLLARWQARSGVTTESADWAKVYSRCEQLPDDDDLLWISVAEDRGTLTVEQADALFSLIEAAERSEADRFGAAHRIRTVDLEATLLHRILGLAKVQIGTGVDAARLTLDALARAGVHVTSCIIGRNVWRQAVR